MSRTSLPPLAELKGGPGSALRAVLFDAGNTLVFLDYIRLAEEVGSALRLPLTAGGLAAQAGAASSAMEQATGSDQERAAAYLEALFRLSGVPAARMGEVRDCLERMHRQRHLWCLVPERTHESLGRLRNAGLRLGIISNSDGRVEEALAEAGLREYFDVVIDSGVAGIEKPDPAIFRAALDALGIGPGEALYVGDLYEVDIVGARAAGIEAVLLTSANSPQYHCRTVASIAELVELLSREKRMTSSPSRNG